MSAQQLLLTGKGMGAVAVVLLHGPTARAVLAQLAGPRILHLAVGQTTLVKIREPDAPPAVGVLDDALVLCIADQSLELHLHGGVAVVAQVMTLLEKAGAARASDAAAPALVATHTGGPWTSGIAAEVLQVLPQAASRTAVTLLAAQHDPQNPHSLAAWAAHWTRRLQTDGTLWPFQSAAQWLLDRAASLRWLLVRPRIAIVGPPNAGKSTLANALLGRTVSITSDIPGTTRDWVDAAVTLQASGGAELVATLVDTAGIRATTDPLEQESIQRTHRQIAQADAVIAVVDGSAELPDESLRWLAALTGHPMVLAINKMDRGLHWQEPNTPLRAPAITISALHGAGLDQLMEKLLQLLGVSHVSPAEPWAFTERQRAQLHAAALARSPEQATNHLKSLLGQ